LWCEEDVEGVVEYCVGVGVYGGYEVFGVFGFFVCD